MKFFTRSALVLSALTLTAIVAGAADWTRFRGSDGNGVSPETNLPVKWSKTEGLKYKIELPGRGLSNPVIAGGRVYLTASSGYRETLLHVICLEEATGKKLWERKFTATGNTLCHPVSCMAAPTPVTDGKAVYALFATGDLAALDRDGALLWYRSLVGDYPDITNQVGMAASPVLAGKTLLVPMENAGDSFIAGLDIASGKNIWKNKRAKSINWVTPVVTEVSGELAALFPFPGNFTAIDPKTGKVRWKYENEEVATIPSATVGGGAIYVPVSGERGVIKIQAIKPGDEGSAPKELFTAEDFSGGYPSPLYHAGKLYGLTSVAAKCFSATDGKELWKTRVDGPFSASPVLADGKLYVANGKGRTTVLDITGDQPKLLAKNDLDDTIQATPAIANGCIYLRSDKYLYCIGAKK